MNKAVLKRLSRKLPTVEQLERRILRQRREEKRRKKELIGFYRAFVQKGNWLGLNEKIIKKWEEDKGCERCLGDCKILINRPKVHLQAHFAKEYEYKPFKLNQVIGPDTGLITWMFYHKKKDYEKADKVRDKMKLLGLTPAYLGNRYEVHGT